jgi:hypothetical protein
MIYISLYKFAFEFADKEELLKIVNKILDKNPNSYFLVYVEM